MQRPTKLTPIKVRIRGGYYSPQRSRAAIGALKEGYMSANDVFARADTGRTGGLQIAAGAFAGAEIRREPCRPTNASSSMRRRGFCGWRSSPRSHDPDDEDRFSGYELWEDFRLVDEYMPLKL